MKYVLGRTLCWLGRSMKRFPPNAGVKSVYGSIWWTIYPRFHKFKPERFVSREYGYFDHPVCERCGDEL